MLYKWDALENQRAPEPTLKKKIRLNASEPTLGIQFFEIQFFEIQFFGIQFFLENPNVID
mgnify:CR=1 FL=1